MRRMRWLLLAAGLLAHPAGADPLPQLVAEVSAARIHDQIAALEYRRYTPEELDLAAAYIAQEFGAYGYAVRFQDVNTSMNVVARLAGATAPDYVFVVGAHYDTVSNTPGADDNASGVAAVLEIARVLAGLHLPYSVDFVAFTLEEISPFFQGSREYVRLAGLQGDRIIGMICFDMIGYTCDTPGCQTPFYSVPGCLQLDREGVNVGRYAATLVNDASAELLLRCQDVAQTYVPLLERLSMQVAGNGTCFGLARRSDQVPFWDAGLLAIEFLDTYGDRNPYYHTPGDLLSTLDIPFCRQITQVALAMTVLPGISGVPEELDLADRLTVFPSPARAETHVRFELARPGSVRLSVLDVSGRIQRVLASREWPAGAHEWVWDGRDATGRMLGKGIYYVRLTSHEGTQSTPLVLLP